VLAAIATMQPRNLVYVSCHPESLARDLALLVEQGFRVEQVQPVDMFPQTPHVENVARLKFIGVIQPVKRSKDRPIKSK
jgi:23S rRNA (uracil1939-C5)-methyltransferase